MTRETRASTRARRYTQSFEERSSGPSPGHLYFCGRREHRGAPDGLEGLARPWRALVQGGSWRRAIGQSRGLPTLAEPFGGRSTTCERVRRFRSNQVLQERARTEHVVFPAEKVSRRSGEQRPSSQARFWRVPCGALGFLVASQPAVSRGDFELRSPQVGFRVFGRCCYIVDTVDDVDAATSIGGSSPACAALRCLTFACLLSPMRSS